MPGDMIYYLGGGCVAIVFIISVSYWAVNFFIRQCTERTFEIFRERVAHEADVALKLFREGLCEQIVLQEHKSDALAKLYAVLIDLLQMGKELTSGQGNGEVEQLRGRVKGVRERCDTFADTYQKQSLNFSEEFCHLLDAFIAEQKPIMEYLEGSCLSSGKGAPENDKRDEMIRYNWGKFEDRITSTMESLRTEFRRRQPAGSIMMKWLKETPSASPRPKY